MIFSDTFTIFAVLLSLIFRPNIHKSIRRGAYVWDQAFGDDVNSRSTEILASMEIKSHVWCLVRMLISSHLIWNLTWTYGKRLESWIPLGKGFESMCRCNSFWSSASRWLLFLNKQRASSRCLMNKQVSLWKCSDTAMNDYLYAVLWNCICLLNILFPWWCHSLWGKKKPSSPSQLCVKK